MEEKEEDGEKGTKSMVRKVNRGEGEGWRERDDEYGEKSKFILMEEKEEGEGRRV